MTTTTETTTEKDKMMDALATFIRQRAGLEFGNYGDWSAYRQEQRSITKDRHEAFALWQFVQRSDSVKAERIAERATKGQRLSWNGKGWDYCTGQYFPTEYRPAVCRLLSAVLWDYFREDCGCDTREKIQQAAKRCFPRAIVRRWFN